MFSPLRDRLYPEGYEQKEEENSNKKSFEESYHISRQWSLSEGRTSFLVGWEESGHRLRPKFVKSLQHLLCKLTSSKQR